MQRHSNSSSKAGSVHEEERLSESLSVQSFKKIGSKTVSRHEREGIHCSYIHSYEIYFINLFLFNSLMMIR